jgi:hypothetical protein
MESIVLTDPKQFPDDGVVFGHLGKRRAQWEALFEHIHAEHPDFTGQWRYYKDGKSWLMKVSRKQKTVFWLSVLEQGFRITCYFTDKAAEAIKASTLAGDLKAQFIGGRRFGKLGGITITFTKKRDVEDAKTLIALKLAAR